MNEPRRWEIQRAVAGKPGMPKPHKQSKAPRVGRSNEGKPRTRKGRFGKSARTKWGK